MSGDSESKGSLRSARISYTLLHRPRCCREEYLPFLSADQLCLISLCEIRLRAGKSKQLIDSKGSKILFLSLTPYSNYSNHDSPKNDPKIIYM